MTLIRHTLLSQGRLEGLVSLLVSAVLERFQGEGGRGASIRPVLCNLPCFCNCVTTVLLPCYYGITTVTTALLPYCSHYRGVETGIICYYCVITVLLLCYYYITIVTTALSAYCNHNCGVETDTAMLLSCYYCITAIFDCVTTMLLLHYNCYYSIVTILQPSLRC